MATGVTRLTVTALQGSSRPILVVLCSATFTLSIGEWLQLAQGHYVLWASRNFRHHLRWPACASQDMRQRAVRVICYIEYHTFIWLEGDTLHCLSRVSASSMYYKSEVRGPSSDPLSIMLRTVAESQGSHRVPACLTASTATSGRCSNDRRRYRAALTRRSGLEYHPRQFEGHQHHGA